MGTISSHNQMAWKHSCTWGLCTHRPLCHCQMPTFVRHLHQQQLCAPTLGGICRTLLDELESPSRCPISFPSRCPMNLHSRCPISVPISLSNQFPHIVVQSAPLPLSNQSSACVTFLARMQCWEVCKAPALESQRSAFRRRRHAGVVQPYSVPAMPQFW